MEIGSIYEIDPVRAEAAGTANASRLTLGEVHKYGKKHIVYTASGREAIGLALRSLIKRRPEISRKCLLPAYMCDTVFFPFGHQGWEIHFYHIGRNLQADKEALARQIEHIRPGLLFIHAYYGVDTWKPMRSLLKQWQRQGIFIMEDVTQSYYTEAIGKDADCVVGSLRKWYPVPDGGFAASDIPLYDTDLSESGEFTKKRLELLTQKWSYLYGETTDGQRQEDKNALKQEYLRKNREMEEWLDYHSGINRISEIARALLAEAEDGLYKERRNLNYSLLLEALKEIKCCVPVFGSRTVPEAPLYFPVYVENRESLQGYLAKHGIYAPVLWPIGEANRDWISDEEEYIYEHLLALPMDQRYGKAAMEQVAEALHSYEKGGYQDDRNTGGCQ